MLEKLKSMYLEDLKINNYAQGTIAYRDIYITVFITYLKNFFKIEGPDRLNKKAVEGFVDYAWKLKGRNGKKLKEATCLHVFQSVGQFLNYLLENEHLQEDFAKFFEIKQKTHKIFTNVLSERRMKKVLNLPDEKTYFGFRDKVIFELLYNTGMRRMELINLEIYDINFEDHIIYIRQGKGKKDRLVPTGDYVEKYLKEYLEKVRPALVEKSEETRLFVNNAGRPYHPTLLNYRMRHYSRKAKIKFNCHTFRHSFATHMLKNGAGLLYIQQILGHEDPHTTEIYTKVYPVDLKRIVLERHPRNNKRIAEEEISLPVRRLNYALRKQAEELRKSKKLDKG